MSCHPDSFSREDHDSPRKDDLLEITPLSSASITGWYQRAKAGDDEAARLLFERLVGPILQRLRRAMRGGRQRSTHLDEEDLAASIFESFFTQARAGRFQRITNRSSLWKLLFVMTKRKLADHWSKLRRTPEEVPFSQLEARVRAMPGESDEGISFLDAVMSSGDPDWSDPGLAVAIEDTIEDLMGQLHDPVDRRIAVARMRGESLSEIASQLGLSKTSVHLRLERIQGLWRNRLSQLEESAGT